jgi:O-antigen ligase
VAARLAESYDTHAHNVAYSVLLGTGAAGACLVVLWLVTLLREVGARVRQVRPGSFGIAAALAAALVNSATCSFIGEQWMDTTLVFTCLLSLHARSVAENEMPAS